jgi:crotonobetainyl-CoA:carnitine CoA-transferase CaiB-like acyl-CoA transferase
MAKIFYRIFPTRDGMLAVACPSPGLRRRLLHATGLDDVDLASAPQGPALVPWLQEVRSRLEAVFASRPTSEWKRHFDALGIPASPVRFRIELLDDPQAIENGLVYDLPHPELGPIRVLGPIVRYNDSGFRAGPPPPPFGSETAAILAGLGFSAREVERLADAGVVHFATPSSTTANPVSP